MEREKLFAVLASKKVSACDTGHFGHEIGHLIDHGLTDEEIHGVVDFILEGIRKVLEANPTLGGDFAKALKAAFPDRAIGGGS